MNTKQKNWKISIFLDFAWRNLEYFTGNSRPGAALLPARGLQNAPDWTYLGGSTLLAKGRSDAERLFFFPVYYAPAVEANGYEVQQCPR